MRIIKTLFVFLGLGFIGYGVYLLVIVNDIPSSLFDIVLGVMVVRINYPNILKKIKENVKK